MRISKVSSITGRHHTRDVPVTGEQLAAWDWGRGLFIQDAMPNLSEEDREFLLTGITPEEWNAIFNDEEG